MKLDRIAVDSLWLADVIHREPAGGRPAKDGEALFIGFAGAGCWPRSGWGKRSLGCGGVAGKCFERREIGAALSGGRAAERTREATWKRTASLLDTFKPDECSRYLVNAGYAATQTHPALN